MKLKAVDAERNQIILLIQVPQISASFQILNFESWKPKIISDGEYTSPRKNLFLAYPPAESNQVVDNPLLIDPESCQTEGYIMCESDSLLERIPGLTKNRICTRLSNTRLRFKRDLEDLYTQATDPTYDLTKIFSKTVEPSKEIKDNQFRLEALAEELDKLLKTATEQSKISVR